MNRLLAFLILALFLNSCGKSQFANLDRPDAFGNILKIKTTYYDAFELYGEIQKNKISYAELCEYYKDGNLKNRKMYDEAGDLDMAYSYEYDRKGHLTKIIQNDPYGEIDTTIIKEKGNKQYYYQHDSLSQTKTRQGNRITLSDAEGKTISETSFDNRGRILMIRNHATSSSTINEYDEFGLCKITIDDGESSFTSEISPTQFDENGNYTSMIMSFQGEVLASIDREITYWQ